MQTNTETTVLTLVVEGMSCDHCRVAITDEVSRVSGVESVEVDLEAKRVRVGGTNLDESTVIDAVDEAGYDAVTA
jgi:copper chaperone